MAYSVGTCMAARTWETSTWSLWQAAPAEAATVGRLARMRSASLPRKAMLAVLGSRSDWDGR